MKMFSTPLRYPGGKGKLAGFMEQLCRTNALIGGEYAEPYAGGAGIAFDLLLRGCVTHVHLNDIDGAVFSFWYAVLNETEWLCRKISDTPLTVKEWKRQREIRRGREQAAPRELGFAFFYLNRTNRSGILNGGVIGGLDQTGEWKIDARYNREHLVERVERIADIRERITVYNVDAADFIRGQLPEMPQQTLVYLDPPYFVKGNRLYENHYRRKDHAAVAELIQTTITQPWVVSYDNVRQIRDLYRGRRFATYKLDYSAATRSTGTEAMFFSNQLRLPEELYPGMRLYKPRIRRMR